MGMLTYEIASRKPEEFRSLTGLSVEEFDDLYSAVEQVYQEAEDRRLTRPNRRRKRGGGRKFLHDLRNRLLLTLTWLRVYPSYRVLGLLFNLDKSNICRNLKATLPALQRVTNEALPYPDADRGEDDLEVIFEAFPQLRAIIDATEQRIRRPKDNKTQKVHYSGKKKAHTLKAQIVVNLKGRIFNVSDSVAGSQHDLTLERQSRVNEELPPQVEFIVDKGYQGLQDDNSERTVELPHRKPRGGELTEDQKASNRLLSGIRIVVEHTLAHMKIFQVLYQVYRHARDSYVSIFRLVAGLVNRHIDRRLASASP
jgi:hypothetical protein